MPQQHSFDVVAQRLATWVDETASQLADGMREGGHAPFAANASNAQKLHYYESTMFNPDGSPNVQGRMAEMHRLGPSQYAATLAQVQQARQGRLAGPAREAIGPEE